MSIAEAFEGVIPARPGSSAPTAAAQPAPARPAVEARSRTARSAGRTAVARRVALARSVRRTFDVVYLDTADSWFVNGRSPSARDLWQADYTTNAPDGLTSFRVWCRLYRVPAVTVAWVLDTLKFLFVHPVRGPLTVCVATILTASVALATN